MLTGFILGVIVSFFGSAIFSVVLAALMEVGSLKSVRIAAAGQSLVTMLRGNSPEDVKEVTKNYALHSDKQTLFQAYGKQLVPLPQNKLSQQTKDLVKKLLMAKIRMAGMRGITSISDTWLEGYINAKYGLLAK